MERVPGDVAATPGLRQAGRTARIGQESSFRHLLHSLGYLWTNRIPTSEGPWRQPRGLAPAAYAALDTGRRPSGPGGTVCWPLCYFAVVLNSGYLFAKPGDLFCCYNKEGDAAEHPMMHRTASPPAKKIQPQTRAVLRLRSPAAMKRKWAPSSEGPGSIPARPLSNPVATADH